MRDKAWEMVRFLAWGFVIAILGPLALGFLGHGMVYWFLKGWDLG